MAGVDLASRVVLSRVVAVWELTRLVAIWELSRLGGVLELTRLVSTWEPTNLVATWEVTRLVATWEVTRPAATTECTRDMVQDQVPWATVLVAILPAQATVLALVVDWKLHVVRQAALRPTLPGLTWAMATDRLLQLHNTHTWVKELGVTRKR